MGKLYLLVRLLIFTFVTIWLLGCAGRDEKDIQGKWKVENVGDITSTYIEFWTFKEDGGDLIINKDADPGNGFNTPINDTCRYYINARLRKTFVHIENCIIPYYNGDWQIIHLNKSIMMIVINSAVSNQANQGYGGSASAMSGGLLFREFTKQ